MSLPQELIPTAPATVMELASAAGIDVSQWGDYKKGPAYASTNPKYCYAWSYVQPGKVVLLNLWLENFVATGDVTEYKIRRESPSHVKTSSPRESRRSAMLNAIEIAHRKNLPIRVISRLKKSSPLRILDTAMWTVASVSAEDVVLRRGNSIPLFVDQFSLHEPSVLEAPAKFAITGSVFRRDPAVRKKVLSCSGGVCRYCGQPGFKTLEGYIYLETHHIIPLHEGGPDHESNVVALCPNHHREAHSGAAATAIRSTLIELLCRADPRER